MEKTAYILLHFDKPCGVILASDEVEFDQKLETAIRNEIELDDDSNQFSIYHSNIGDWGETCTIEVQYVNEGELLIEQEFSIIKTVKY